MPKQDFPLIGLDWSGIVSDDRRCVHAANNRILAHFGKPTLAYEIWLPKTYASVIEMARAHDIDADDEVAALYVKFLADVRRGGLRPTLYPDALDFIEHIAPKRCVVVVSTHPQANLEAEALEYGLNGHIHAFFGSVKRKADVLMWLAAEHGLDPGDIAFIGDMIFDIRAAKEVGVFSIGVASGYHSRDVLAAEKPDLLVDSLSELQMHF